MIDKSIASSQNPLLSDWRECLQAKGIKKHGLFFIAGERAVRETLERFPHLARSLILCAERHVPREGTTLSRPSSGPDAWTALISDARSKTSSNDPRFSVISLARPLFEELDVAGTHAPLLLTRTPDVPKADLLLPPQGLEILCALGDPANVGALLRSAAAFGAEKVVLLKESASPFHPKAVRAASASTLLTPLAKGPSIRELPAIAESTGSAASIVALDMLGSPLENYVWPTNIRLLIGEEGEGVPGSKNFDFVAIAMRSSVESLNATVAASIALYSYSRRSH
jgi:TrmH family RNA methyltransferase